LLTLVYRLLEKFIRRAAGFGAEQAAPDEFHGALSTSVSLRQSGVGLFGVGPVAAA
jgi:hypothetical protein